MSKASRPKYRKGKPPKPGGQRDQAESAPVAKASTQKRAKPEPSQVVDLTPLAPIIVRAGRPFDSQAGVDPARLPPPSTLAGCLRSAWARQTGEAYGSALSRLDIAGPLLVREAPGRQLPTVLVPKPADALYFGTGSSAQLLKAAPCEPATGEGTDLPGGLALVSLTDPDAGREKPGKGPAWWSLDDLLAFRREESVTYPQVEANGWSAPAGELRTHVAIAACTGAAETGKLFQTRGLDLGPTKCAQDEPAMRLLARCAEPLAEALVHLGGERRLAALGPAPAALWPAPPADWSRDILAAGGLTLTLVTPAVFSGGYLPGWVDQQHTGSPPGQERLQLQLVAVACGRWEPHSGWDLAAQRPRRSRRLVPSGATFWFRLAECPDPATLDALWLSSLCDDPQDRRDGFGLALTAPWKPTIPTRPVAQPRT